MLCRIKDPNPPRNRAWVSILTRPYGRMLYHPQPHVGPSQGCFNPHPPLRADAIRKRGVCFLDLRSVSILTRPYGRMLCDGVLSEAPGARVSILTRPYGRMLFSDVACLVLWDGVSILTRPYGRMLCAVGVQLRKHQPVSILTRPYGRMLYMAEVKHRPQDSVSILTRPYGRMLYHKPAGVQRSKLRGFNPHPPLRADAMRCSRINGNGA